MPEQRLRLAHLTTVDMSLSLLLATELRVDVEAGHEVFGISAPGPYIPDVEALGVTHVPVPSLSRAWGLRSDIAAARELGKALRTLELDVLHTHTPKAGVMGRVLGRLARIPVVVNTCHGLWATADDALAKRVVVYGVEAVAAWFSHAELYQNDTDRRTLQRFIPRGHGCTVGNGIDLDRFRPDPGARERIRAELGVARDEVLIGGVGRLVAEKGIREYISAAAELRDRARFIWVGPDDPAKPDAVRSAGDVVDFMGLRQDMPDVYAALDVFVLPSYREGFSRSAMEAAASGCALVLSDIRGCREIGAHDREVLLVPPRDPEALRTAIARLIDDPPLRARLTAAVRHKALASFDQRGIAAASLDTYRRIAQARRKTLSADAQGSR